MLGIKVSKDGSGDYCTIQEALDSIPYDVEATITICEGIYREKIFSDKRSLRIKGEGKVLITWSDGAKELLSDGFKRGTFRTYTAFFSGERVEIEGVTISNSAGSGKDVGQGIALYLDAEEAILNNVVLKGHQDTLFLAPLPDEEREKRGFYGPRHLLPRRRTNSVFNNCRIEGTVDFIFGGGDALFLRCDIVSLEEGYVAAPSGKKDWKGMTFDFCIFSSTMCEKESVFLMRPWRDEGKAMYKNCVFGPHIRREGFSPWPGREDKAGDATFITENCTFR